MQTRRILLLGFYLLAVAFWGEAQSPSRFANPKRGAFPMEKNGAHVMVAIARSDIQVRNSVQYSREGALELWSPYYVYAENPDYYYLAQPSRDSNDLALAEHIGWVHKQYLLDTSEALRTPNKIYRRIIVFDNRQQNRVPVYSAPLHRAKEISETPLFSFFYIYKETDDYYLIGVTPQIDLEGSSQDLLGWLHRKNCREWNTRLAVSYRADTQNLRAQQEKENKEGFVRIYKTFEDTVQEKADAVIAKESENIDWRYNMLRYPLLESSTSDQKRLFQIAFLSGDKSDNTQQIISKIKEEKEKLHKLDIMLVIDASLGASTREKIMQALEKSQTTIKTELKKKSETFDVAWGMTFFHDFEKGKKYPYRRGRLFEPHVVEVHDFTNDMDRLLRTLTNQPFQGYRYETKSLFYGLDMALHKKARWREGSTRCVVAISETGNHAVGDTTDLTKLTIEDIASAFQKEGVRYYGLHFEEHETKSALPSVQSFGKQSVELAQKMNEGGYCLISGVDDHRAKTFALPTFFKLLLTECHQEILAFDQVLSDLSRGFSPEEVEQRYTKTWKILWLQNFQETLRLLSIEPIAENTTKTTVFVPELKMRLESFLARHAINLQDLKEKGIFYDKGWVWEIHPKTKITQIQVWILIDQMELSRLIGFMSGLLMQLKNASNPGQYIEIWKTLLKATFGIDTIPANEPLDNLILQHTGLPFMNGLLNYTLDDFVKKAHTANFRRDVIERLETTCNLLFLVLQEKEIEQITTPDSVTISQTKKRWWTEEGSDIRYAWLEVEMFP